MNSSSRSNLTSSTTVGPRSDFSGLSNRFTARISALLVALGLCAFASPRAFAEEGQATTSTLTDDYPLTTCIVMVGQKLGRGGKGHVVNYEGREVRLCCKKCVKDFNANPQKYLPILDAAVIAKEKPNYPLSTCVVSGQPLDPKSAVDFVYKNHLVRFCCADCKAPFLKEPDKFLGQLTSARTQRTKQ